MENFNIILATDSYKMSHPWQYPTGTDYLHSYLESRGGETAKYSLPQTKFFGLSYYIKKYLSIKVTTEMIDEADELMSLHGVPFDRKGWERIITKHDGYIPLKVRAVKEGSIIPRRNVLMTIESTDKELFWLVGWAETLLLKVWYPTTVATLSNNIYNLIKDYMVKTADTLDKLPFMLHDFGYRGTSSEESAGIGGMAHLTNFKGTDTIASIVYAKRYYDVPIAGFSIPASEHSTMTSWGIGTKEEEKGFKNMIEQFGKKDALFAVVSDSWNFNEAIKTWSKLSTIIKQKGTNLVVRPDSGDALVNVLTALKEFEKTFGYTVNSKGYKVLNNVALIQGDGVNEGLIYDILNAMEEAGFSAQNIAFGMGAALLQGNYQSSINRDTNKFAIKLSAKSINGVLSDVFKDPISDSGKRSKKGRLDLIKNAHGEFETIKLDENYPVGTYHKNTELVTYYENGKMLYVSNWDDIVAK